MRTSVRLLHSDLPGYFIEKRARLNSIGRERNREQHFWEMASLSAFLFLLVASVLVLVFA